MSYHYPMYRLFALFVMLASMLMPAVVKAADDAAEKSANLLFIADQLKSASQTLDKLGSLEKLGEKIPLTSTSLTEALKLADLFKASIKARLDAATSYADETSLQNAINGETDIGGGGKITFSNASVIFNTPSAGFVDVSFGVVASKPLNVPIAFASDAVNLDGGSIAVNVLLSTNLKFRLDTSLRLSQPTQAFFWSESSQSRSRRLHQHRRSISIPTLDSPKWLFRVKRAPMFLHSA